MATAGGRTQWGVTEQLLARLEYLTEIRLWQAGGGKGSRPEPRRMPWESGPQRTELSDAEMQARLLEQRLRHHRAKRSKPHRG